MIDTAGTITEAAKILLKEGARQVFACATHAVFSPPAIERLSSGCLQEVIVTNTIPIPEEKRFKQLTVISVANFFGETILRLHEESSISNMFH
jgi:ribose-phosphate pyrophosphokinase